jgi:hypothetical protein
VDVVATEVALSPVPLYHPMPPVTSSIATLYRARRHNDYFRVPVVGRRWCGAK